MRHPDLQISFLPVDSAAELTAEVMTSTDGERQYLVIHDGTVGLLCPVADAMDVTDVALRVEAAGRQARPASR